MGITVGVGLDVEERLSLLAPGGEAPRFITLERRWERVDGGALVAMVAHTGDPELPIVRWDNPFTPARKGTARNGTTTKSASPAVCSVWSTLFVTVANPPTARIRPGWTRNSSWPSACRRSKAARPSNYHWTRRPRPSSTR